MPCQIVGCDRDTVARGLCRNHYQQSWKRGESGHAYRDPEEAFAARTERRGECLIWTGAVTKNYGIIWVAGASRPAHVYAWERVNGSVPDGMLVDHRDHCDTRCVEVKHLRLATVGQNNSNRSGAMKRSRTGVRNVSPSGAGFRVQIRKDGVLHQFGTYPTVEEAAKVAEEKRTELFGEFAGKG